MNSDALEVTLSEYRLGEVVGESEMATLYRATEKKTGRLLAIKVSRDSEEAALHVQRESNVLSKLTDDPIAQLVRWGVLADGRQYLVRDYVVGDNLDHILSTMGRLSEIQALTAARSIAKALAAAHRLAIIHRDIKPSNIIIPRGEGGTLIFARATLTDFGAAGRLERQKNNRSLTAAGQIFGTPLYMSPEQLAGLPQTAAADVYGLGLLLYRMLFGRLPYPEVANFFQLANHILHEEVVIPAQPEARESVARLVLDCLAKDPGLRPRDGSVLLERLSSLIGQDEAEKDARVDSSLPNSGALPAAEVSDGHTHFLSISSERYKAEGSSSAKLWLVAMVGLCLVFAGFWLALGTNVDDVATPPEAFGTASRGQPRWWWSIWGVLIAVPLSAGAGYATHRWLEGRHADVPGAFARLLTRSRGATALRESLAIDLEKLIAACREVDQAMIAKTVGILLYEYDRAKESTDRQAALVAAVGLIEKLSQKLLPWYVRYRSGVAWGISIAGSMLGVAKTAFDLWWSARR